MKLRLAIPGLFALGACGLFDEEVAVVELRVIAAATARLGDSVTVRVTIENRSDVTVTYQGNFCPRFFAVLSASGESAGPPYQTIGCLTISIMRDLAPGERHEYEGYWLARTHGPRAEPIVVRTGRHRIDPIIGVAQSAAGRDVMVRKVASDITIVE